MGTCSSSSRAGAASDPASACAEYEEDIIKLVLLGTGESGKSTVLRQFRLHFGSGPASFTEAELEHFRRIILGNILTDTRRICQHLFAQSTCEYRKLLEPARESWKRIRELPYTVSVVEESTADDVLTLWRDPIVQDLWATKGHALACQDNYAHFVARTKEIVSPNYCPSIDDVLKSRCKTVGVSEHVFTVEGTQLSVVDVGGQRNQRKNWLQCLQQTDGVLFVVALPDFSKLCEEDKSTNRMKDALRLWAEVAGSPWLQDSAVILLYNKSDVFYDMMAQGGGAQLRAAFPAYQGSDTDAEAALEFIKQQFRAAAPRLAQDLSREHSQDEADPMPPSPPSAPSDGDASLRSSSSAAPEVEMFQYVTSAVDTEAMPFVLRSVSKTVLRQNMASLGVL